MATPKIDIESIVKHFRFPGAAIDLPQGQISEFKSGVRTALVDARNRYSKPSVRVKPEGAKQDFESDLAQIIDELPLTVNLPKMSQEQMADLKLLLRNSIFNRAILHLPGGQTVYCELANNEEVVDLSKSVRCTSHTTCGKYYCEKHSLLRCPSCGSPVQ